MRCRHHFSVRISVRLASNVHALRNLKPPGILRILAIGSVVRNFAICALFKSRMRSRRIRVRSKLVSRPSALCHRFCTVRRAASDGTGNLSSDIPNSRTKRSSRANSLVCAHGRPRNDNDSRHRQCGLTSLRRRRRKRDCVFAGCISSARFAPIRIGIAIGIVLGINSGTRRAFPFPTASSLDAMRLGEPFAADVHLRFP